jgi:Fe-S-cluster-containing hydrogenase component 2/flavodoxin
MKASILTFSQTGNTLNVGNSIGNGLQDSGIEVWHEKFLRRNKWIPNDADIIGIGCPVFENRPAEVMPEFLKNSGLDFRGKKAFVFITSGGSPAKSLWHLSQAVTQTGASVIGGIQVRGTSSFPTLFGLFPGRPDTTDLEQAESFGRSVAAHLIHGDPLPSRYAVEPARGGRFYDTVGPWLNYIKKKTTPLPVCDPETCDLCGTCVYECPTNSITIENKTVTFQPGCIVCYRCWHVCPTSAISIDFSPGNGLIERLIYAEKMERLFGDVKPGEYMGENLYKDVLSRKIKLRYNRKNPTADYEFTKRSR